jgi:hypothetical protein
MNPTEFTKPRLEKAFSNAFESLGSELNADSIADMVFETGPEKPYEIPIDLMHLYASNLRNGGSPAGPNASALGKMTKWAFNEARFATGDKLVRFNRQVFASFAARFVKNNRLSKSGGTENEMILTRIAVGDEYGLDRKLLFRIVNSIERFAHHLIRRYQGSAIAFSEQFVLPVRGTDPVSKTLDVASFRDRLLSELNFPLMGPAISSNLLKDSQVGRAKECEKLAGIYLGALAKPDMHVMRLMLTFTARVTIKSEADLESICFEGDAIKLYNQSPPGAYWPDWGPEVSGEERCLRDLNFMSFINGYSSLFADRILFMVGSGRSKQIASSKKGNQLGRYRNFLNGLGLLQYRI